MEIKEIVQLEAFQVEKVEVRGDHLWILARSEQRRGVCPSCQNGSSAVHSQYRRYPRDIAISGRQVQLELHLQRFYCRQSTCPRRTFVEQHPQLLERGKHQTERCRQMLRQIGFSSGGEGGARLAHHLALPTSPDTLLRLVKSAVERACQPPKAIGVDDWAWRKGVRYGTLIVNLEGNRPIDLLPDRQAETLAAWLAHHPGIEVVARDRSTEYRRGISMGAPCAQQVADRWHLLANLNETLERVALRLHQTVARTLQDKGFAHQLVPRNGQEAQVRTLKRTQRQARYEAIRKRYLEGASVMQLTREFKMSRGGIRHFAYAATFPEQSPRRLPSQLDPYRSRLEQLWDTGCHVALRLWRTLQTEGFSGSPRQIQKWVQQRRLTVAPTTPGCFREAVAHRIATRPVHPLPSAPQLASLWMRDPDHLTTEDQTLLTHLQTDTMFATLLTLAQRFIALLRTRRAEELSLWFKDVRATPFSELHAFVRGLEADHSAVVAAFILPYSNGPVEGHVNRLKTLKRQMYGRAGFALLRARVLHSA